VRKAATMNDSNRLTAFYADELRLEREQVTRRSRGNGAPPRRTTRRAVASTLHRLADRLDGE
jgi:hypothetical protein